MTLGGAGANGADRTRAARVDGSRATGAGRARTAGAVALLAAGALAATGTASAAPVLDSRSAQLSQVSRDGYRYWSFWDRDGDRWTYASQGPASARPADGDVQGFRFSVSEDSRGSAKPRGTADFEAICGGTPAEDGRKRVAFVLDFGTAADAPGGATPPKARTECARVPEDASSAEALAAVAKPLRYDSAALLCAIAGYPAKGCGERVPAASSSAATSDQPRSEGGGPAAGLLAGAAAVAVLGVAAAWQARRRRGG